MRAVAARASPAHATHVPDVLNVEELLNNKRDAEELLG